MNDTIKITGLSILSGLLLWVSWPMSPAFPLVFIGFVPLLFAEKLISEKYKKSGRKVFIFSYLTFLIWNFLTTWWVSRASLVGGSFAVIANAALMAIPFVLFHHTKKSVGNKLGMFSFLFFYLGFEYLHLNWEFTWSWLTLGNVFAKFPDVIQWYEYTGVLGGSLWDLIVNLAIFEAIQRFSEMKWKAVMKPIFMIVLPLSVSYSLIPTLSELTKDQKEIEVVVIQPNIDSYKEKFKHNARTGESNKATFMPYDKQLQVLMDESKKLITPKTKYLFWPETSVPKGYWEKSIESSPMIRKIKEFVKSYDGLTLITGIDTYSAYKNKEEATPSARFRKDLGYYDVFNTAMQVNSKGRLSLYHKSKLVPGVERMPYPQLLSFLEYFSIDLGGISGSLGTQNERVVFYNENNVGVAPTICYESIFGGFVGEWVNNGAQFIAIITNDNWWDNTQGHQQHFEYARLRAIENRRFVARAANTGISGFINPNGEVLETLDWGKRGGVRGNVVLRTDKTYYTVNGDYIGRIASFIAIIFFLSMIVKNRVNKKK